MSTIKNPHDDICKEYNHITSKSNSKVSGKQGSKTPGKQQRRPFQNLHVNKNCLKPAGDEKNKPSYLRKENVAFTPNDIDSREENENTMSLSQEARVQTNSSEDNIGSVFRRNGWSGVSEELEGLWDLKTARPIHEDDDNNKQFGNENKSSPLQGQRNEQPLDWTNILSMEKPVILVPPYLFGDN